MITGKFFNIIFYNKKENFLIFLFLLVLISGATYPQLIKPENFLLKPVLSRISANDITDIVVDGDRIWFGTSKGLVYTDDGENFYTISRKDGLGKGGVSAIGINDGVIWIATSFDSLISGSRLDVGGGLSYSRDNGMTWNWLPQPVDDVSDTAEGKKPTTTAVQNVTYDIAFRGNEIWIASWGGGLRRSKDSGKNWETVTPDKFPFDVLTNLNHRAFSVISAKNGLWVGTAGGINKSTDGGKTWTNYTAQNGSGISGNFVVALKEQVFQGKSIIWAATWKAEGKNEFDAVSKTENGGLTWEVCLEGEKAHNFAFFENEVYVARSVVLGNTWI